MNKFFITLAVVLGFASMAFASSVVAATGTTGQGANVVVAAAPVQPIATQTFAAAAIPIVCPAGCIPSQGAGAQTGSAAANAVAIVPMLLGAAALALF